MNIISSDENIIEPKKLQKSGKNSIKNVNIQSTRSNKHRWNSRNKWMG